MKFVLVDYHKGNIKSVERGLAGVGADVVVSDSPEVAAAADAIVLPGVGAFTDAMNSLDELGLADVLRDRVNAGVPFLGICLGLHLMFDGGEEHAGPNGPREGLGFIPGVVCRMPKEGHGGKPYKIPHVGWNSVEFAEPSPIFDGINPGEFFYFTHSFAAPESGFTIGQTTHSVTFPSVVRAGNAFGVQFHPEKSSDAGARMLSNFVDFAKFQAVCI